MSIKVHCSFPSDISYAWTWVTSRDLADDIGISHKRVLKKIKQFTKKFKEFEPYVSESSYVDVRNRCTRPMFKITRQGVDFLINKIFRFRKKKALLLLNGYHRAFDITEEYAKANDSKRDWILSYHL